MLWPKKKGSRRSCGRNLNVSICIQTVLTSYDSLSCNRRHHQVLLQVNLISFPFLCAI